MLRQMAAQSQAFLALLAQYRYLWTGKKAWSVGYLSYRWEQVRQQLYTQDLSAFRTQEPFAPYGVGLDERVVEYAWLFAHLPDAPSRLLDAGSVLNFAPLVQHPKLSKRELTISTLAPERFSFWDMGISYHYGDLRALPFLSEWFDEVVCLSTLEHVGMDNRNYGATAETLASDDFLRAVAELVRVLKVGGALYISVPYGVHEYVRWGDSIFMQQFDATLLAKLIDAHPNIHFEQTFFRYSAQGWQLSTQSDCDDARYFNIHESTAPATDGAAAARAVACLYGRKIG